MTPSRARTSGPDGRCYASAGPNTDADTDHNFAEKNKTWLITVLTRNAELVEKEWVS